MKCYLFFFLMVFSFSCKKEATKESGNTSKLISESTQFITIDINNVKDETEFPISELIESLDIIPLESKDDAFVKIGRIDVSKNYIGIRPWSEDSYRLFDRKGKYLCKVGNIGQGPGEYTALYSSQLEESVNRVYLSTYNANKIYTFDLKGNFLSSECIPFLSIVPKCHGYVDVENQKVIVVALPFKGDEMNNVCWVQNFKGEIIQSVPADIYSVAPDYSNEITSCRNTNLFDFQISKFYQEKQDTLYHYNILKNCVEPILTISAPLDPGKISYIYVELPHHYMVVINNLEGSQNPDTDVSDTKIILVDKKTQNACYVKVVNDFLGGIEIDTFFLSFQIANGYFTSSMEPMELKERLEDMLNKKDLKTEVRGRIERLYKSMNINDNNIVMIGKLK